MAIISKLQSSSALKELSVSQLTTTEIKPGSDNNKPNLISTFESIKEYNKKINKQTSDELNKLYKVRDGELEDFKNIRIKLTKKQFFINVIESIVSLTSFAVSVGLSICSGGVATPVAILTGLNLMLSLSNLACAYHNWNCASKKKEELAMGNDGLQQSVFMLAEYCQASPINAKKIARFASYFIRIGIVVSLGVVGGITHQVINNDLCLLAKNYAPIFTSMLSAITAGALGAWKNNDSDAQEAIIEKIAIIEQEIAEKLAELKGRMNNFALLYESIYIPQYAEINCFNKA